MKKAQILDPSFKYVPASKTDIRKTFARERARLKAEAERAVLPHKVSPLKASGGRP